MLTIMIISNNNNDHNIPHTKKIEQDGTTEQVTKGWRSKKLFVRKCVKASALSDRDKGKDKQSERMKRSEKK